MSTAPALTYDFAPVQAFKQLLQRGHLAKFNSAIAKKDHDPHWLINSAVILHEDLKGEIVLDDSEISITIRNHYLDPLPPGRYRAEPYSRSYGAAWTQKLRFWHAVWAPFALADLDPYAIYKFAHIVSEATRRNTMDGFDAERDTRVKQQLLKELEAGEEEQFVILELLRLTSELAAELQIGCKNGFVDTCDIVGDDFTISPHVTGVTAIAYMRSIGACNIPVPIKPRAKTNWKTDIEALRELWDEYQRLGQNKTKLAEVWGISRAGIDRPLRLAAAAFGYRPKIERGNSWESPTSARKGSGDRY